jgi:hypothetical protein
LALATSASDSWTVNSVGSDPQTPFKGTPFAVGATPVTIQAEDYDLGGEGVAFHDTTPTTNSGGGYRTGGANDGVDVKLITNTTNQYRIGDAFAGEWVEYSIDVQQGGDYKLDLRLSQKDPNAKMHVEIDGGERDRLDHRPGHQRLLRLHHRQQDDQPDGRRARAAAGVRRRRVEQHVGGRGLGQAHAGGAAAAGGHTTTIASPIVSYVRDGSSATRTSAATRRCS